MEYNSEIYLSPNYKKDDYRDLHLTLNSSETVWKKAIDILADRIEGRFLSQIEILSDDINSNGFAIMALNCLLVETMLQFEIGRNSTPNFNRDQYSNFLLASFPEAFVSIDCAIRFYLDIRCGILHSAQTKGHSKLTCDNTYIVRYDGMGVTVSVEQFSSMLLNYFETYKRKLLDKSQTILRTNFINKMDFVCRR